MADEKKDSKPVAAGGHSHAVDPAGKLCVRAKGSALVCDYERLEAGIKKFIGRKIVNLSETAEEWAFIPTDESECIPDRAEYRRAVRDGELWAASPDTAKKCGVKFDPNFTE
jgi:hypothetical protein